MSSTSARTAYFDFIFDGRERGEGWSQTFEDFNHWGYWEHPEQAGVGLAEMKESMARLNDEALRAASVGDGVHLLDVGCGFGGTLRTVNDRWQGVALTGVDRDDRLIGSARRHVAARTGNRVDFFEGCATRLPVESGSQDVVTALECIFHFPSRQAFMAEALRVLRPGGRLVVVDYLLAAQPTLLRAQRALLERGVFAWLGTTHVIGEDNYRAIAREVGFERVEVRDITRQTLPTYASRIEMFRSTGRPLREMAPRIATMKVMELGARSGLMRYGILVFHKAVRSSEATS